MLLNEAVLRPYGRAGQGNGKGPKYTPSFIFISWNKVAVCVCSITFLKWKRETCE